MNSAPLPPEARRTRPHCSPSGNTPTRWYNHQPSGRPRREARQRELEAPTEKPMTVRRLPVGLLRLREQPRHPPNHTRLRNASWSPALPCCSPSSGLGAACGIHALNGGRSPKTSARALGPGSSADPLPLFEEGERPQRGSSRDLVLRHSRFSASGEPALPHFVFSAFDPAAWRSWCGRRPAPARPTARPSGSRTITTLALNLCAF